MYSPPMYTSPTLTKTIPTTKHSRQSLIRKVSPPKKKITGVPPLAVKKKTSEVAEVKRKTSRVASEKKKPLFTVPNFFTKPLPSYTSAY